MEDGSDVDNVTMDVRKIQEKKHKLADRVLLRCRIRALTSL